MSQKFPRLFFATANQPHSFSLNARWRFPPFHFEASSRWSFVAKRHPLPPASSQSVGLSLLTPFNLSINSIVSNDSRDWLSISPSSHWLLACHLRPPAGHTAGRKLGYASAMTAATKTTHGERRLPTTTSDHRLLSYFVVNPWTP